MLHFAATSFNRVVSLSREKSVKSGRAKRHSQLFFLISMIMCHVRVPWTLIGTSLATMATMGHGTRRGEKATRGKEVNEQRECKGACWHRRGP